MVDKLLQVLVDVSGSFTPQLVVLMALFLVLNCGQVDPMPFTLTHLAGRKLECTAYGDVQAGR